VVTLEGLNAELARGKMPKGRLSRKYWKHLEKGLPQLFLIFFQAAVAFGAIMSGLEAGRHLKWW
jgi:hypothetical protein